MTLLTGPRELLSQLTLTEISGSVAAVRGMNVYVEDLPLPVGAVVALESARGDVQRGEVIGFDGDRAIVTLFGSSDSIAPGARVIGEQATPTVRVGSRMLGRIINGLGKPIDGGRPLSGAHPRRLYEPPMSPLRRRSISEALPTGVRAIDAMTTLGKGQRIGIFSAAGVGKSTLVGTMARHTAADVNVIALIGERGREVREFIDEALGEEGLARSVVVVATGDESPLMRVRAAQLSCAVAEYFRDLGQDVLLMMDSVTRFAQAQRQIGLAIGEQPATKGYTPSVFAMLPALLERAGAVEGGGSITGLYAVLVEGDDLNEPIADACRGVLDGHIVLSRRLAARGHYPAIDVLESISRVAEKVVDPHHAAARRLVLRLMAAYRESEELINIGAYAAGSNREVDVAIGLKGPIDEFLQQAAGDSADLPRTCRSLLEISGAAERALAAP